MSFLESFESTMGVLTAIALFIIIPLLLMYAGSYIFGTPYITFTDKDDDDDNPGTPA